MYMEDIRNAADKPNNEQAGLNGRVRFMLDAMPFACIAFDTTNPELYTAADCNEEAIRLLGFPDKEAYLSRQMEPLPRCQPDGANSRLKFKRLLRSAPQTGESESLLYFKLPTGEELPLEVSLKRASLGDRDIVFAYLRRDVRAVKKAREEAQTHARLLEAVNSVATRLMSASPGTFDVIVWGALRTVGQAANADRSYIWENFEEGGKMYCRQIYEWSEGAEPQQGKAFAEATDYDDIPMWKKTLLQGVAANGPVSGLTDGERPILEMQGIKSILLIPIHSHGKPWGFIGFDDCREERTFSKVYEQVLQSAGILIVSAILRNNTTRRLIDMRNELYAQDKLLRSVNTVARILLESGQEDFMDCVRQALLTLGGCAGVRCVAVWRNDEGSGYGSTRLAGWTAERPMNLDTSGFRLNYDEYVPGWSHTRHDVNGPVAGMDARFRALPLVDPSQSLLLLPLNIHGDFWGFISFLHEDSRRLFSENEKNILRSGGLLIASAVIRNETVENLVEARESALASMRAKSEFLSRMSHEIRTPMNAIIGMSSLAMKSADIEKVRHYMQTVNSSSKQLLSIINDVLDMSKIDANKLEIENKEFNFEEMIRRVINVTLVRLDEKKIDFRLEFPKMFTRYVVSDELRLSQVLLNLLNNAAKFTPEKEIITLKIHETPVGEDESRIRFEVADRGIGISPEALPKVFKSFEQADGSITRQYGGTGLGLSICREIMALMGGKIWAESELGKGSTFIVELNVKWGVRLEDYAGSLLAGAGFNILVVDDAPMTLAYISETLAELSLSCETAINGETAIRMAERRTAQGRPYNVAFVDWNLPGMSGEETAEELCRALGNNVEVVIMSTSSWGEIENNGVHVNVNHFLSKPLLSSDLYNVLLDITKGPLIDSPERDEAIDFRGKCILLAEDIEINREVLSGMLEDTGVVIESAENGLKAVQMYATAPDRYDLILMDVQMPVMDGLSATREIRASGMPGCESIPIIAMTANAFKEDEETSLRAGMNGHISKPVDMDDLLRTLKKILAAS